MNDLSQVRDKFLYRACEECVADAGKEDDDLVMRLYNHMYEHYDKKGKSWNYGMIDRLIEKWS